MTKTQKQKGQSIGEYALLLAVLLTVVVGVVRLIGVNALGQMDKAASQISGQ